MGAGVGFLRTPVEALDNREEVVEFGAKFCVDGLLTFVF